ncbi:WecB/TagA/CpsF family glycosyltransferase [Anabaena sp. UHCC 0187]|uniref:WecB/TagA/CpsF family glycosyltransferase n=1 Tax=Anabaena sp. UHCC 0187 TaxID=2590018 RepID=UPI00144801CF|nr:WecB/TagA/CpsF family glycosyltransferase [Anabaena sp. UHCC 0187]MTJ14893.1 WecB/TagA/CpsF family glycosyltransferase [Anabaena sp. UHCC 0187]
MNPSFYNFLGIHFQALTITKLNLLIGATVEQKQKWIIAHHNLHSLYLYHHQPKMQDFYAKADYIHIDGMALVLLGQRLGLPLQREHRITYADWIWPLITDASQQGWRIFYLGSKPGVAETGATILRNKFPGLEIMTTHGYIDPSPDSQENQEVLAKIKAYQPHILMVGMGMPRQENWILDNLEQISANVILPCGACIDYVAGAIPTPPRWMGRLGVEWLYRLLSEPRRLWKRYLLEPWFILKLFLQEMLIKQFKTN